MISCCAFPVSVNAAPVLAWGENSFGQTNVPSGLTEVVDVGVGDRHSTVLTRNGLVLAWGDNGLGQTNVPAGLSEVVALQTRDNWNMALKSDGSLVAWGEFFNANFSEPMIVPPGVTDVQGMGGGFGHVLAIRPGGRVVSWGYNAIGQTNVPFGLNNVVAVAGGSWHSLALLANGRVIAWGSNTSGQSDVPAGLEDAVDIAAAREHSLALRADGTVVVWGSGTGTGLPSGLQDVILLEAAWYNSAAIRSDGSLLAWGRDGFDQADIPPMLTDAGAVAVGRNHSMAAAADGAPWLGAPLVDRSAVVGGEVFFYQRAFGQRPLFYQWKFNGVEIPGATNSVLKLSNVDVNDAGSYSIVVSNVLGATVSTGGSLDVVPLRISRPPESHVGFLGEHHTLSVEVETMAPVSYQWQLNGADLPGATQSSLTVSNLTFAMEGDRYSVRVSNSHGSRTTAPAELSVGHVAAWGENRYGETDVPKGLTNVVDLAAGTDFVLALHSDSTVSAWGRGIWGQKDVPAGLSNVVAIAADGYSAALRADGTVVVWGAAARHTTPPPEATNIVAIDVEGSATLALRADGQVIAWGSSYSTTHTPQQFVPAGLSNVVAIASGGLHSAALRHDGTVVAWGPGFYGTTDVPPGLGGVVAIAASDIRTYATKADGSVVSWGASWSALPSTYPTGIKQLAGGETHNLALMQDGTVRAWVTERDHGQADVPAGLDNVKAIDATTKYSLALVGPSVQRPPLHLNVRSQPGGHGLEIQGVKGRCYLIESSPRIGQGATWTFFRNFLHATESPGVVEGISVPMENRFLRLRTGP